jgi:hypothetical protein
LNSPREPWRQLEIVGTPPNKEFRVAEAGLVLPAGAVLYALDASGRYHLLVPVERGIRFLPDRRSAGVHIEPRQLEENGSIRNYVDVVCMRNDSREVFSLLVADMLESVGEHPSSPLAACKQVLSTWRELLQRAAGETLSREALGGLFGELWQLRRIASQRADAHLGWHGPNGGIHDFLFGTTALEVKTSMRREGRLFEIHGVDQLDPPVDGVLYLAAMKLIEGGQQGETVPELVEALLHLGIDRLELLKQLSMVGYDSRDAGHYSEIRYSVQEERFYQVGKDFPRIVRGSFQGGTLPPRVQQLRYVLDLDGEPPIPLTPSEVEDVFFKLAQL